MSRIRLLARCLLKCCLEYCIYGLRLSLEALTYVFTEWPWKTVLKTTRRIKILENDEGFRPCCRSLTEKLKEKCSCCIGCILLLFNIIRRRKCSGCVSCITKMCSCIKRYINWIARKCRCIKCIVITSLRLTLIVNGMALQLMTCFRRYQISTYLVQIAHTTTKQLSCDKKYDFLGGLLLPGLNIFLLACWVYMLLKFGYHRCKRLRKCLGWDKLNIALKANGAKNLNELVQAVKSKLSKPHLVIGYTVTPILLLSVWYLFAFHLIDEDVGIQTPLGGHFLIEHNKNTLLAFTFVVCIALDILYLTVIMRYVYQCQQMIIYYLQLIWDKVKNRRHTNNIEKSIKNMMN